MEMEMEIKMKVGVAMAEQSAKERRKAATTSLRRDTNLGWGHHRLG